jgi:hypothetical protein
MVFFCRPGVWVLCGCIPHAQTEKKGTLFASSGVGQTSAQLLHRNASSRSNYFAADLRPRLVLESNQGELLSVVFNAVSEAEKVGGLIQQV